MASITPDTFVWITLSLLIPLLSCDLYQASAESPSESTLSNKCPIGFYWSESPGGESCEKCHKSCLDHCRSKGPRGCEVCREGYSWEGPDYGCLDIDECLELGFNPCPANTFCVNGEGAFDCFKCDKSCDGCKGDGPDECKKCADGFTLNSDGVCTDVKLKRMEESFEMGRYFTYVGLCIATCIIFHNNIWIASVIGVLVASYIGLAEWSVRNSPVGNPMQDAVAKAFASAA